MKKVLLLGIAAGLLAFAGSAFAYPTLTGPTGLVNQPTAMVAPAGQFNLAADFYNTQKTFGKDSFPIRMLYGVSENFEIGGLFNVNGADLNSIWGVNTKLKTPLTYGGMDWALGATYQAVDSINYNALQAYFVGTRKIAGDDMIPEINATIGANWTQGQNGPIGAKASAVRGVFGVDLSFQNKLQLAAEYQTKSDRLDGDAVWGVVARVPFSENIAGEVGATNGNGSIFGYTNSRFFAGINYSFGMAEPE